MVSARPNFMRPLLVGLSIALFCSACASAPVAPHAPSVLPLRTLRLYETGVGYFERTGQVDGDNVLPVPTSHLDDALKSLVILGPKAKVQALTFPSNLSRTMARALVGLPEGSENLAYRNLLSSLKGGQVELTTSSETLSGRVVEVSEEVTPTLPKQDSEGKTGKRDTAIEAPRKTVAVVVLTSAGVLRKLSIDAITGVKPLDPTFAQRLGASLDASASRGGQAQRALKLLGNGGPVTFGYIAETPVWRASYRILIEGESSAFQGWALLHNDTDEDWKSIRLSLVNGRPDSFLFPLAAPRYLRRELVHPDQAMPTVPQLLDKNADELWGEGTFGAGGLGLSGYGEGGGGYGEGYGVGGIGTIGHRAGMSDSSLLSVGNLANVAQAAGSEQGALFSYSVNEPISLPAHSSALVPFLEQKLALRQITWVEDGARSGVRFENSTGQTLPAGTVAFFGGGGFSGESTLERLKPGERRFLTFGADLDVELTDAKTTSKEEIKRVVASGNHLEEHFLKSTERAIVLQNRSPSSKTVYLVLKLHHNAEVTGADALDFDTEQNKPVALFELTGKQKVERVLSSVEGLSRSHDVERLSPEEIKKIAESPQVPSEEKIVLRDLANKRAEQDENTRLIEVAASEMAELDKELDRLRKHLEALGGDKSQRPDTNPFVKRILAAEDRRSEVRTRHESLKKQSSQRRDSVLAILKKLELKK